MKDLIFAALPWVVIGLAIAVLCAFSGKKEKKANFMTEGMAVGMCAGVALSVACSWNLALGISLGMLAGETVGLVIERK